MLNKEHREFLKSEQGRKWFIEKTLEVTPKDSNWQSFHTPYDLCKKMISKTDITNKSILILFNIEFLEVLIHKFGVSSKNILFLADCRLESEMSTKIYKVDNIMVHNINDIQEVLKKMKTFDLCFSNPPYTGDLDARIITKVLPICSEIIVVHPAAWLIDNKCLSRSYFTKYREAIKDYCESAYIFDGNSVFNIVGPCSPFTIFKINKYYKGKIKVNYFDEKIYEVDNIYDVSIFGNDWLDIVKPFVKVMKKNQNIWDHPQRITKKEGAPKDKIYFQCRALIPGTAGNDVENCLIQLSSDDERYIVLYDNLVSDHDASNKRIRFYFDSEEEIINFINYLKTDFVRFCITIYKNNEHLGRGELRLVPWMDFTQEWTDKKLYKFFNIPQETIEYITNFFPDDLYDLRNK